MAQPDELVIDLDDIDHIILGETRSPGVCTVSGFDRAPKWDVKDADGQAGASSSLKGESIRRGQVSFYLVHDGGGGSNDFEEWDSFQRLIESTINGKPNALPIYHPDLVRLGVTEVCCDGIAPPLWDGRGGATVVVKFIEYRPPKPKPAAKAVAKPAGATQTLANTDEGPRSPPPKPDPNEEAKRELAALSDEARAP